MRAPCSTKPAMAFASSSCSTLTREMLGWRENRTRAIIPETSKCADQPHQLVHHRPFGETREDQHLFLSSQVNSSQVKSSSSSSSSQVKFIQTQQKKVFNLKYVKGSTSYTFITLLDTPHVSSISSQQKPSTFLRGLSCASIHTEYYVCLLYTSDAADE